MKSNTQDDMDLIKQQLERARGGMQIGLQPVTKAPVPEKVAIKEEEVIIDPAVIEKNKTAIKAGYQALFEEIQQLSKEGMLTLDDLLEPLPVSVFQIKDEVFELLADPSKRGENGITLVGCSEQSLLGFYLIAMKFHDEKLLDKTQNAFILLTHIAPQVSPFWLGLGISYEAQQKWSEAGDALQKAIEVNPEDFAPFRVLIRIAAEIHDFASIKELLEVHKETKAIKEDVETALECLPGIMKGGL